MKVKCTKNEYLDGCFIKNMKKVTGLTVGKIYTVMMFSKADGTPYTDTYPRFFLYNDYKEWKAYYPELFEPVGD